MSSYLDKKNYNENFELMVLEDRIGKISRDIIERTKSLDENDLERNRKRLSELKKSIDTCDGILKCHNLKVLIASNGLDTKIE